MVTLQKDSIHEERNDMSVEFKSRQISPRAIRINGKIKKAIDACGGRKRIQ